jgi:Asp-tRNA(Asn)/Glu-tRNA(Gln) amidotransferase C subunit
MSYITQDQLDHIQQLSSISLKPFEQESFLQKLDPIISKLNELASINTNKVFKKEDLDNTLRSLD